MKNVTSLFIAISSLCLGNPFEIDFLAKETLTNDDYETIQAQMRQVDLERVFEAGGVTEIGNYLRNRVGVGHQLQIIDQAAGLLPETRLVKIGSGGNRCFVTYASFNRHYADLVRTIAQALESVGYNGYFYYRIGGFPNPTGIEARYAAVPYAFKIFMMQEAFSFGLFNNVIWIDAALTPLHNPEPLFDWVDQHGYFFNVLRNAGILEYAIPPPIRTFLANYSHNDYLAQEKGHINMTVFGLRMDRDLAQNFIHSYYELVELGTPFISSLPEEYVISSIMNQPQHRLSLEIPPHLLMIRVREQTPQSIEKQRKKGYFFLNRAH